MFTVSVGDVSSKLCATGDLHFALECSVRVLDAASAARNDLLSDRSKCTSIVFFGGEAFL